MGIWIAVGIVLIIFYGGVGIWETMDDHNVTENNVSGNDIEKENYNVNYYKKYTTEEIR